MTIFYIGVGVLLVMACVFVMWPLLARRLDQSSQYSEARELTNVALYRDHLADIDESMAQGVITNDQYAELKMELEKNLLEDSQYVDAQQGELEKQPLLRSYSSVFVVMFGLMVVLAAIIYIQLGAYSSWQLKSVLEERAQLEEQYLVSGSAEAEIQLVGVKRRLLSLLDEHIQNTPDDLQMRALQARTFMTLGDYSQAIPQFKAILQQDANIAQIIAELAQAEFLLAKNQVTPVVQTLVGKALDIEPNNVMALGLAGIASFQAAQYQQAIDFWQKAVQLQGANSPGARVLQGGISAARQQLGSQASDVTSAERSSVDTVSIESASGVIIDVEVSLADDVDAAPTDTVFIYARAWNGAKVPLAITRVTAAELPFRIVLTDAMAMAPGMNLSSVDQVELVARLSKGGGPVPQSGDWQATLGPVDTSGLSSRDGTPYSLIISELIP